VLHRDLAHDYQAYLLNDSTVVETHGDDVGSFAAALERMLQRLDGIKQNQSRDQFETKTML
jgi:inactivated superfamily I helicase